MKHRLELELDLITDTSPLEVASKVEQAVREVVATVKQSLGTELTLVLDGLLAAGFCQGLLAPVQAAYEDEKARILGDVG